MTLEEHEGPPTDAIAVIHFKKRAVQSHEPPYIFAKACYIKFVIARVAANVSCLELSLFISALDFFNRCLLRLDITYLILMVKTGDIWESDLCKDTHVCTSAADKLVKRNNHLIYQL